MKRMQITCFCSRPARRLTAKHHQIPAERSHLNPTCDVASKQSRLEPVKLCSVASSGAASVLWRLFETVEQLKQAIVDEWCALSQKFIDRSINEWRRRMKCVVQQNGRNIGHLLKQLFSPIGYTRHLCYSLYTFVNCIAYSSLAQAPHLHACCSMWRHLP